MKRYVYVLCLLVAIGGISSCKKNNEPEPIPVVVGKWTSDYLLASGFVAPYTANNGLKLNPLLYGISDTYDIKADKTFIVTDRSTAVIRTLPGTWDYADPTLTLKYDSGDSEKLTYDASGTTPLLKFPVSAVSDTLTNPTTKNKEVVKYNLQLVYSKQ